MVDDMLCGDIGSLLLCFFCFFCCGWWLMWWNVVFGSDGMWLLYGVVVFSFILRVCVF